MKKVFIDGKEGTTGLQIVERLENRNDIELLFLPEEERKDINARRRMINKADIVFLCLPDAAAKEAVSLCENLETVIIDASTAHRTDENFTYGFPELSENTFAAVKNAKRIANPGCHASGFISLIAPLTAAGILKKDTRLSCHSLTGYSGGGKKMIAQYESADKANALFAPRQYGVTQLHKHLPEMQKVCGLTKSPAFSPIVDDFYSGMLVTVPVFAEDLMPGKTISDIKDCYRSLYTGPIVSFNENGDEIINGGFISANALSGKDSMQILVSGNEDRILLISLFDNLGKGASGAAVENMNITMGLAPETGLNL
ncbi:MAG: N-acetyl-gamma-glutamyl-phosphate reductase [Clostridiales bacterium]|nr:N-acetyl-gamma-glutamyl-phosphate reductase [Clostridiales bacterium]